MSEKELQADAVARQIGNYKEAQKALADWLEETEEMLDKQGPPSADHKVARAQLQALQMILKHVEDKQPR